MFCGVCSSPDKRKIFGEDPHRYQYVVQEKKGRQYSVKAGQISRKKKLFTREKCKLYLKQHSENVGDGVWKVKVSIYLKDYFIV